MDASTVPKTVINELAEVNQPPSNWSDDYVKVVTDWARQFAVKGAIERHKKGENKYKALPWSTVDRCLVLANEIVPPIFLTDG